MIKKLFIAGGLIWFAFLAILVFREQIVEFLSQPKTEPEPETVQVIVQEVVPPVPKPVEIKKPQTESIPFAPLPDAPVVPMPTVVADEVKEVKAVGEKPEGLSTEKKPPAPEDPFGLICTKFEKIPSRFRLVSWEGTKKVEIEDLSKVDSLTKKNARFWLNLRVPYKEFIHPTSKDSFFKPTTMNDPNKRLIAQSFEIKNEALAYTARINPIGYLILRDFKIGGPPYQVTSEMGKPLTSSYYLNFEQNMGPQKFFHDLTGKHNGYPFGGWNVEYRVVKVNFNQNQITVLRKDLKDGRVIKKELNGPSPL